jgi:predicted RNase H-related nuclease YkuK (DUF458 family)
MKTVNGNSRNNHVFRTSGGSVVEDLRQYIIDWMAEHNGCEIYIGSDSQVRGDRVKYSTVVCLWDVGHGVWEAYRNEELQNPKDRYTRLWNEVTRSVELADELKDLGEIHVHMDYNSNPKYPSYQLYDAGIGYVTGMGFNAAGKPLAWAASSGANRHCQ